MTVCQDKATSILSYQPTDKEKQRAQVVLALPVGIAVEHTSASIVLAVVHVLHLFSVGVRRCGSELQ